ncbi:MAG: patatin-like phospholipase family protein [Planctomycetaceae bacterium]|nr:patatin-like phospholipase family protein [Planctomycetaceae bacterium]
MIRSICILLTVVLAAGCGATRDGASDVHPSLPGRAFQECPIDMSAYRSAQERAGQDADLALAVAISGGGQRAANFAAGVMLALEEISPGGAAADNALRQVDYVSSVSGGSLAAAAYLSSLNDHLCLGGSVDDYSFAVAMRNRGPLSATVRSDPQLRRYLEISYVRDIVKGAMAWTSHDRGEYLEAAFDDNVLGRTWRRDKITAMGGDPSFGQSLTLGDIFVRADSPRPVRLPYWVANAAVYENGALFPFTPDQLKLYQVVGYTHRFKRCTFDAKTQSYEEFLDAVPLSLAAKASGTFPAAIPATVLRSEMDKLNPYLYLFDGGIGDNLGTVTALRMLKQDQRPRRKVLLVIDASADTYAAFSKDSSPPGAGVSALQAAMVQQSSYHGRYRELTQDICRANNITPIFLSFDDLADLPDCAALCEKGLTQAQIKSLSKEKTPKPFHLVRDVPTWYSVAVEEQSLLLSAGQVAADLNRDKIRAALGWPCAPPQPATSPAASATD